MSEAKQGSARGMPVQWKTLVFETDVSYLENQGKCLVKSDYSNILNIFANIFFISFEKQIFSV